MTMPEKIWIDETSEDCDGFIIGRYDRKYGNVDQCYIRKDLADELARDLQVWMDELPDGEWKKSETLALLARYNAATEGM